MGRFLDIVSRYAKGHPASEIPESSGVPDINTACRSTAEVLRIRDEWADACLALARALDWEEVTFKQGHRVASGQHGWRKFCTIANLTQLRDQTYPALVKRLSLDRPPGGQHDARKAGLVAVYLCWLDGEHKTTHWHEQDTGFAGRKPL